MMLDIQHQDPRILRTRRLLIDAFISLMGEFAYDEITITQITQRATVNRATFYAHFADKSELAEAMAREDFGRLLDSMVNMETADPHEFLASLFKASVQNRSRIHTNCQTVRHKNNELRQFEAMVEGEMRLHILERVHGWFKQQGASLDHDVVTSQCTLVASLLASALYAGVVEYSKLPSRGDAEMNLLIDCLVRMVNTN